MLGFLNFIVYFMTALLVLANIVFIFNLFRSYIKEVRAFELKEANKTE